MNISKYWNEFTSNFNKMIDRNSGQMTINFERTEEEIREMNENLRLF